jgi:hypothetical protein
VYGFFKREDREDTVDVNISAKNLLCKHERKEVARYKFVGEWVKRALE